MEGLNILLTLGIPATVALLLAWRFPVGLRVSLALLVLLPISMRIELGGGLPALTVHRLILIALGLSWLKQPRTLMVREVPLLALLLLSVGSSLLSTVFSIDPIASLKSSLSLSLEFMLVYLVIATQDFTRQELGAWVKAICVGLSLVAMVAGIEKYTGVNVVTRLLGGSTGEEGGTVQGTYPHRILLGYAMVFGWLYAVALNSGVFTNTRRSLILLLTLLPIAGCYYSVSRGPWIGLALAFAGVAALGGRRLRSRVVLLVVLASAVLVARPGVWDTVEGLMNSTFQENTLKGRSYEYRWRLWTVATTEISKSPLRFLIGYGGSTTDEMDLSGYFGNQEGGGTAQTGFTSWDNQYASDLIEYGVLGFLLNLLLLVGVLQRSWQGWRTAPEEWKPFSSTLVVAVLVYLFAMSNVSIFAPQLKYLFWATAGLLVVVPRIVSEEAVAAEGHQPDDAVAEPAEERTALAD